ncbi:MAG TPA: YncE family protein [bacterium]|nr:YncE family protein [bacterium]
MTLHLVETVGVPPHRSGAFDHGDVQLADGRVFVAHTATGTVEVIDGERGVHQATVLGCPEASGVLCAQDEAVVFAAARGAGRVRVLDATSNRPLRDVSVGPKPNGLAWDSRRKHLLVADVQDFRARLVDLGTGEIVRETELPGRPRWCAYDPGADRFLVNIREPACVALLTAGTLDRAGRWAVSAAGPHGLDLDLAGARAFVACDGGRVSILDLNNGREIGSVEIAGEPDAIWYNPARARLYVAIGRPGMIDVLDTLGVTRVEQVITEEGAHTTAFDPIRQLLYAFLPRSCSTAVYVERAG